ncbi:MAG: hypothetical protein RLW61_10875 [Gammaproteobacteria bacterium]
MLNVTRWILGIAFSTFWVTPAASVTVFGQYDGSMVVIDPLSIDLAGPGYAVKTDLARGIFRSRAAAPAGRRTQNAYTGFHSPLALTNNGTVPLVFQPGFIALHVHGTYALGTSADSQQSITSAGVLAATTAGVQSIARADHTVSRVVLDNGALGGEANIFKPTFESNGARVVATTASMSEVEYELLMPRLVVDPGHVLALTVLLAPSASAFDNGAAAADFFNTATLTVRVPAGFALEDLGTNAGVPLEFVSVVPLPASAWFMAGILVWLQRKRTPAHRRRRLGHST